MYLLLPFVIPLLALPTLAYKSTEYDLHRRHLENSRRSNENATRRATQVYKLKDIYQGQDFLDQWNFFSGKDPTHGKVKYQTKDNAIKKNLAFVQQDGTMILAVDDFTKVPVDGKRDSVRISSKKTYNHGLFIADFFAMPHGCSVWPAYWSVGPNWPSGGEIDVVEGVREGPRNQITLHTSDGCNIKGSFSHNEALGNLLRSSCKSSVKHDSGCAFSDPDRDFYGHRFNLLSGGVFAHLWDSNGIKVWRFTRKDIPADIRQKQPDPSSWGTPVAYFPSTHCDIASHFYQHSLVLDITLCGDWAGSSYVRAGCPGTCSEAVANPANFKSAKWKINYIAVYQ